MSENYSPTIDTLYLRDTAGVMRPLAGFFDGHSLQLCTFQNSGQVKDIRSGAYLLVLEETRENDPDFKSRILLAAADLRIINRAVDQLSITALASEIAMPFLPFQEAQTAIKKRKELFLQGQRALEETAVSEKIVDEVVLDASENKPPSITGRVGVYLHREMHAPSSPVRRPRKGLFCRGSCTANCLAQL